MKSEERRVKKVERRNKGNRAIIKELSLLNNVFIIR
jgi:hypothetical protein